MSTGDLVTHITVSSVSVILGFFAMYHLLEFYKMRHDTMMTKRKGNIVIAYTICAIIVLLFGYPLNILFDAKLIATNESRIYYKAMKILDDLFLMPYHILFPF